MAEPLLVIGPSVASSTNDQISSGNTSDCQTAKRTGTRSRKMPANKSDVNHDIKEMDIVLTVRSYKKYYSLESTIQYSIKHSKHYFVLD